MRKVRRAIRLGMPAGVTLVAYCLLTGCFYVPIVSKIESGPAPKSFDRPTDLKKLVKIGRTTKDEIEAVLGRGQQGWGGELERNYSWMVTRGYWVYPLCFMTDAESGSVTARLRFDEHGVLQGYEVGNYQSLNAPRIYLHKGQPLASPEENMESLRRELVQSPEYPDRPVPATTRSFR